MKILFICSSNVCRSPYCEYVFKKMVSEDANLQKHVTSIKSAAVFNRSKVIHPKAKLALMREGFSEEQALMHKPKFKKGDEDVFDEADLIIGMERFNKMFLPRKYWNKYKYLSEFKYDKYVKIPDPFLMKDMDDYYRVMDTIKDYLIFLKQFILLNKDNV